MLHDVVRLSDRQSQAQNLANVIFKKALLADAIALASFLAMVKPSRRAHTNKTCTHAQLQSRIDMIWPIVPRAGNSSNRAESRNKPSKSRNVT